MNLNQHQIETQNAILMAVHKTDDLEEAKRKEVGLGCLVKRSRGGLIGGTIISGGYEDVLIHYGNVEIDDCTEFVVVSDIMNEIIGLPPSLPRVLSALGEFDYGYYNGRVRNHYSHVKELRAKRNLLLDTGESASLRDQSEETQEAIHELLVS